jgi:hypothetical protein
MYVEASVDMKQGAWIQAHIHAFRFFCGVPKIVVIDNLKVGVIKPDRYEPVINDTYTDMARYYNTTIVPTRVAYPKGKAQVERTVQIVETWIIAYLRHRIFFTFGELNEAITQRVAELNAQIINNRQASRDELFAEAERPLLKALPATDYEMAIEKTVKLAQDCHFQLERQRYSAPCEFVGCELVVRITQSTVEAFKDGVSVCIHRRLVGRIGQYSTKEEHMPDHLRSSNKTWSQEGFSRWAAKIGPNTRQVIEAICSSRKVVEQSYRSCRGILALAEKKGALIIEQACAQALELTSCPSYTQIRNIASNMEISPIVMRGQDELCQSRLGDTGLIRNPDSYTFRRE